MKILPFRLKPNQDLRKSLKNFAQFNHLQCGFILTAVGSLKQATLRFAGERESQVFSEKFEIVSLGGTLGSSGIHCHLAISDRNGRTIGGHLMDGCLIYTTAEIVIGSSEDFTFLRTFDEETGFQELEILSNLIDHQN